MIRYAGQNISGFKGQVTCVKITNTGLVNLEFEHDSDYKLLVFLARNHFKLKTRKKRIVKKYLAKFINEALRKFLEANRVQTD